MKPHEYLVDNKLFCLRVLEPDGSSFNGFKNSLTVGDIIECPDWDPKLKRGNGLHAWPLGIGRGSKEHAGNKIFQVVSCTEFAPLGGKIKAPRFRVEFVGNEAECMAVLQPHIQKFTEENAGSASNSGNNGSASNSGYGGSASNSGYRGSASNSGNCGSASNSGERGSASNLGNYGSASNSGNRGSASNLGEGGSASVSNSSVAISTGINSRVKAGKNGCIVLPYVVDGVQRYICATVDDGTPNCLKSDTWYREKDGKFVECT